MTDQPDGNVRMAVPFLGVADMPSSLAFYVDGLGFSIRVKWTPDSPDRIRWCWLENGGAAMMLQEYRPDFLPPERRGVGVSVCFWCQDALAVYRDALGRGLAPKRPFVGNRCWVVELTDPDGYEVFFESPTDTPEETQYDPRLHG